ncbi:hypothetical protein EJ08DRAFT_645621 [Tothia fuscella]|uniref:Mediator of RNA polymerase II transcription subunit 21 n=1 Tax=Tothia fuscella TaxID=1048955 RepID=A0A9P4U3U0_9PEZI|nr:hypothetical protein EJ08DRAFT_645621 [Tothia fuscella]
MYASIRYIDTHHPPTSIPNQPDFTQSQPTQSTTNTTADPSQPTPQHTQQTTQTQQQQDTEPAEINPNDIPNQPSNLTDTKEVFEARLQELAQDLIVKERQIEALVETLPGLGNSQQDQERRIKELEEELRDVERERLEWDVERERLLEVVEGKILGIRRV